MTITAVAPHATPKRQAPRATKATKKKPRKTRKPTVRAVMPLEPEIAALAYSRRQVAQALGLSESTVKALTNRGELPSVRLGGRVIYPVAEVLALLNSGVSASA